MKNTVNFLQTTASLFVWVRCVPRPPPSPPGVSSLSLFTQTLDLDLGPPGDSASILVSLSLSPSQCLFPFSYLCEWCAPALPLAYLCSQSFSRPPWWRGEEVLWLSSVWQRLKVAPSAPRSTFFKYVFNLLTILSSWLSTL